MQPFTVLWFQDIHKMSDEAVEAAFPQAAVELKIPPAMLERLTVAKKRQMLEMQAKLKQQRRRITDDEEQHKANTLACAVAPTSH